MSAGGGRRGRPITLVVEFAMSAIHPERRRVHAISCEDGNCYVIYEAGGRWYVASYPEMLGEGAGEAYDTAEDAEHAVRTRHTRAATACGS